jgi:hypothetical protein
MTEYTDAIVASVRAKLGGQENWKRWPGGWPNEISTSLIDAVFSARATYSTSAGRGVHAQVQRWRQANEDQRNSLDALIGDIDRIGPASWARGFGNEQHAPGRARRHPDDPMKAAAVREAAMRLRAAGIDHAADISEEHKKDVDSLLRQVAGIGKATSAYFLMLLGLGGVKPDVMINRFLTEIADGRRLSHEQAVEELTAAAEQLGTTPHELEHAIWAWERNH